MKERISRFGRSWGMTVLALLAASLLLAANCICMAERLVEMSLNREYVRYVTVQEKNGSAKLPYNDGIYRKNTETADASEYGADSM